jgi:uncharacterized protein (TIGR03437 family)
MYFTGIGPVTNSPATGNVAPQNPLSQSTSTVSVTVNGVPVSITVNGVPVNQSYFVGLAPNFVGEGQINFQLPADTPSGTITVVLTINNVSSKPVEIFVN